MPARQFDWGLINPGLAGLCYKPAKDILPFFFLWQVASLIRGLCILITPVCRNQGVANPYEGKLELLDYLLK